MDINIYIQSSIKPPRRGAAKAMYMIMSPAKPDDPVKGFLELPDTTEDAITLSAIIEALQRFTRPTTIRIYTKCNGVFHALDTGRIQSAKMNGFRNSKDQPTKNAELWEIFLSLVPKFSWTITQEDHEYENWMRSELDKWQRA
ncbi:MAG: hypothetical protein IJI23_00335 [Lachnospiraceae bacterium]|nr:hypothetical protein [Lachnospiraceae bacterium]